MKYQFFLEIISVLEELYQTRLKEGVLKIYYEILKDLTEEEFKTGVLSLIKTREKHSFPMPAEIRQYCLRKKRINAYMMRVSRLKK